MLGILSLIFWSLILIVSVKYLVFILRADHKGDGGVLALLALAATGMPARARETSWIFALGVFGAALLYGDGMITPAISVLSAVEGLKEATEVFEPFVVPPAFRAGRHVRGSRGPRRHRGGAPGWLRAGAADRLRRPASGRGGCRGRGRRARA